MSSLQVQGILRVGVVVTTSLHVRHMVYCWFGWAHAWEYSVILAFVHVSNGPCLQMYVSGADGEYIFEAGAGNGLRPPCRTSLTPCTTADGCDTFVRMWRFLLPSVGALPLQVLGAATADEWQRGMRGVQTMPGNTARVRVAHVVGLDCGAGRGCLGGTWCMHKAWLWAVTARQRCNFRCQLGLIAD